MLVTARAVGAERNDHGVVGHARSPDLVTWEVGAPLSAPGSGFGQLEVLQPWDVHAARLFTTVPDLFAAPLVQRRDGSWCLIGFRNREAEGVDALEIVDPVPVRLEDGRLVADQ